MKAFLIVLLMSLFCASFLCSEIYPSLFHDFNSMGTIKDMPYDQRDSGTWVPLGTGLNSDVLAVAVSGTDIYVGGYFLDAGGNPNADQIARWDGTQWLALGTGMNDNVLAIAISGTDIYAGGYFTNAGGNPNADRIARWDGSQWHPLGTGLNGGVSAIAISGTEVYVGGNFTDAGGNPDADYIARWDGSQWLALGTGLNDVALAIAISGTDVYVGGFFTDGGGNPDADYIARWDGTQWHSLGTGMNYWVCALKFTGINVYAGGYFTDVGGNPDADYIARWDGSQWLALGTGLNYIVNEISISGTDVYAGGFFTDAGGNPNADYIARWDGAQWHALGTGLNNSVNSIAISGKDVYSGGHFTDAGGNPNADYIALWIPFRDVLSIDFISPPDSVIHSVQSVIGVVNNNGSVTEEFYVHCIITDQTKAIVLDTMVNTSVLTGEYDTIDFGQVNMVCGQNYMLTMATLLSEDMNRTNDTIMAQTLCVGHDAASINFLLPPDTVFSSEQDVIGVAGNVGIYDESLNVLCRVTDELNAVLLDTFIGVVLNSGEFETLQFGSVFMHGGFYSIMMSTLLSGDQNPTNDTLIKISFCYDTAKIATFDFETGWQGWTHTSSSVFPMAWDVKASNLHSSYMSPNPGDSSLWIDSDASGQVDIRDTAISPVFTDVVGGWLKWGIGYRYNQGDTFKVLYRIFNDTVWSSWEEQIQYISDKKAYWDSLNTAVLGFDSMQIAFMYFGNYDWYVSIDNVGEVILPQTSQVEETPIVSEDIFSINYTSSNIISSKLSFELFLPYDSDVIFNVFDIAGRIISSNVYSKLNAGTHNIVWRTDDLEGNSLANGVYFYHIVACKNSRIGKFVVIE